MNLNPKMGAICAIVVLLFSSAQTDAQDLTTAREVLEANIEATGGRAAWESIQDLHMQQEMVMELPMGVIVIATESWFVEPGYAFVTASLVEGPPGIPAAALENRVYKTPEGGWIETANGRQDINELTPTERAGLVRASTKNELDLIAGVDSTMALLADSEFDGTAVYVVQATMNEMMVKLFYDKATLFLIGQEVQTQVGPAQVKVGDYREVGGVHFSFETVVDLGTNGTQTIQTTDMEVNTGLTSEEVAEIAGESDN